MKRMMRLALGLMYFCASVEAVPPGYGETWLEMGRPVSGIFVTDSAGVLYYGSTSSTDRMPLPGGKGSRGLSGTIWAYDPATGMHTKLYDSADHNSDAYQINSATGVAIDKTVGVFYIADNQPDLSQAFDMSGCVWRAADNNSDGDFNDPGETVMVTLFDDIIYAEDIIIDPDSPQTELYVTNAAGSAGSVMVYRCFDSNDDGDFMDSNEVQNYFDAASADWVWAGCLDFNGSNTNEIFVVDSGGSVYLLEDDGNGVLDTWSVYFDDDEDLPGGFGLAVDPDGDVFVTATDGTYTDHKLYELYEDPPGTVICSEFADLSGFAGFVGKMAFTPGTVFEPGTVDTSLYMTYSTITYQDPETIKVYGQITVPAMGWTGMLILCAAIGFLLFKRGL
ncbi:hypothetical protein JXA40_07025 [bacterium]|nr:hypothetical protein [candidate division CSSED10-310 bacterium]